jgi:hypothetical protein
VAVIACVVLVVMGYTQNQGRQSLVFSVERVNAYTTKKIEKMKKEQLDKFLNGKTMLMQPHGTTK